MPTVMVAKPASSTGRRPRRSTTPIAMKVASTFTRPTIAVPQSCAWPWKPAASKMRGA